MFEVGNYVRKYVSGVCNFCFVLNVFCEGYFWWWLLSWVRKGRFVNGYKLKKNKVKIIVCFSY